MGTGRIKVSQILQLLFFFFFHQKFKNQKPKYLQFFLFFFSNKKQVWGCDIIVDWADPQEEPDEGTMSKVKVLYVRNLTQDTSEEKLKVKLCFF